MTLTKEKISEQLVALLKEEGIYVDNNEAKVFVEELFEEIRLALEEGDTVKIANFGNFIPRDKKQRPGRNPKTGEVIPVAKRRVVVFKTGQTLKQRVQALVDGK